MDTRSNTGNRAQRVRQRLKAFIDSPRTRRVAICPAGGATCPACGESMGAGRPDRLCRLCRAEMES